MLIKKILTTFTFGVILAASGCAATDKMAATDTSNLPADQAIAAAELARQSAGKVGYEWRDTAKMIDQAKKLASEGKSDEAITLANKAEQQGRDAFAQYQTESSRYSTTQ